MQIPIKLILLVMISVITYDIRKCQKVSEDLSKETVDGFDKDLSEEEMVRLIKESVTESGEEKTESGEEVIEEITGEPDEEFDDIDGEEVLSGQTIPDVNIDEDSDVVLQAVKPNAKAIKAKRVVSGRQIDPLVLKELCGRNNNPNVVGMVQIHPNYVYVMVKEPTGMEYYRLNGFAYDLDAITFKWNSIDWMGDKWTNTIAAEVDLLYSISQWFRLRSSDGREYLIGLSHQKIDDIDQMTAYKVEDNKIFFEALQLHRLNINLYKYNPGDDPDNLMSMFLKFPQDNLWNRLKAINDLPPSSQIPVPNRYFVYYSEKRPIDIKPNYTGEPDTEFLRHILKQEKVDYGDRTENEWIPDKASGTCIPQPEINGAITLTGYKMAKINGTYSQTDDTFDVLELIKDEYVVQRYQLNLNTLNIGVKPYQLKRGSIAELLGCVKPTPSPPTTTTIATTSPASAPPMGSSTTTATPMASSPTAAPISPTSSPPIVSLQTTTQSIPTTDSSTKVSIESTTIAPTAKSSSSLTWLWILLSIIIIVGLIILGFSLYYFWLLPRPAAREGIV